MDTFPQFYLTVVGPVVQSVLNINLNSRGLPLILFPRQFRYEAVINKVMV